jgi:Rrf2 family protein
MKLITRNTDYALRAISCIARNKGRLTTVSELVNKLKIPKPFLRKILQELNKKKLLISHKGTGGGFELRIPAQKIFLVNLIEVFQGPFKLNECFLKKEICPNLKVCALRKKMDRLERYVLGELKSITIADIIR